MRIAGTIRELPISRGLLGLTVTLLDCSLSQRTDALALQLQTDARDARECSPGGAYRADLTLGNAAPRLFTPSPPLHVPAAPKPPTTIYTTTVTKTYTAHDTIAFTHSPLGAPPSDAGPTKTITIDPGMWGGGIDDPSAKVMLRVCARPTSANFYPSRTALKSKGSWRTVFRLQRTTSEVAIA